MALTPGTKLGPYEVGTPLGAGGMGEVYRARDTRLQRTVAIKVLPGHLASDPEAKQRFDREARAISSLNHPNICTLYDVGHQDGVDFLVMEFLEGQTLLHRLVPGALPIDEVLKYGIEICEGLEKAHRSGVIHRDLKPGNVMLTKRTVKLMDFGLAKAIHPARPPSSGLTETIGSRDVDQPLTADGTIVGTFQYMSPEQVEGKEADVRSDIFALGVVLYEMCTGTRAFSGKTTAAVMAAVLERNPEPISKSNPVCPPALDRAIQLCLAKDPDERWQTVHDVKLELQGIAQGVTATAMQNRVGSTWAGASKLWAFATALLLLISAGLGFFLWHRGSREVRGPAVRALLMPPKGFAFAPFRFALSPDGKKIAFVATSNSKPTGILWVQQLDSMTAQPLAGTEDVADAGYPFWSPESTRIGFFSNGKLKRVEASGGVPVTLANAHNAHGGAWSRDGYIVFSKSGFALAFDAALGVPIEGPSVSELLYRIAATGGEDQGITATNDKHARDIHRWPSFLPDGHRVLFLCSKMEDTDGAVRTSSESCVADSRTKDQPAVPFGDQGQYADGFLLYVNSDGTLMARPVDPSTGNSKEAGSPIAAHIVRDELLRNDSFSVSPAGVLAYMADEKVLSRLVWYSRRGEVIKAVEPAGTYEGIAVSPDGQHVATSLSDSPDVRCLWVEDVNRGSVSRFSEQCDQDRLPIWSHDGSRIAYASASLPGDIYVRQNAGTGKEEDLFKKIENGIVNVPTDFSPDGRLLLYVNFTGNRASRLWAHSFAEGGEDHALLKSDYPQGEAQFSPDGRWLAYVSEETGKAEVYVVPFPAVTGKTMVSTVGGNQPRWRRDGKELFFVAPDGIMKAVSLDIRGETLKAGTPQTLFQTQITAVSHAFYQYDVTADGQKFIVNTRVEQAAQPITIYVNWDAELKR